jgi:tRNA threonylcarbamoyladenosine biosynthesis protein TsaB
MKLLAIEASTEVGSVALSVDGVVYEAMAEGNRHSGQLLTLVDALLKQADVALRDCDAIAVGRGPGSFTGLRIACGVAQGLALGAGLPVVPVSSLRVLAQGVGAPRVVSAFDARMGQVYIAAFERDADGLMQAAGPESVVNPDQARLSLPNPAIGAGSGFDQYADVLAGSLGDSLERWVPGLGPHARAMIALAAGDFATGRSIAPAQLSPIYLRDDVAQKSVKK